MAEIHVQEKKRGTWLWILGIAAAALLIWVIVDRDDREEFAAGDVAPAPALAPPDNVVIWPETERFILFTRDQQPDFGDINAAHEYTRNGLRYLASSLEEITKQDGATEPNLRPRIASLREAAEAISERAAAPEHAAAIAPVFRQAADAMSDLQRARFPEAGDEVEAVRDAAGRVTAEQPLQQQRDAVKAFFDRAVEAVRAMGAPEPRGRDTP